MKMKKIQLFLFSVLFGSLAIAQTGPGGVGGSSTNILWLDASRLGLTNSDPVSSWTDESGNSNNATQGTGANQPTFLTNQVNSLPAVDFDGSNDNLDLTSHITTSDFTFLAVYNHNNTTQDGVFNVEKHVLNDKVNNAYMISNTPSKIHNVSKTVNTYGIVTGKTSAGTPGSTNIHVSSGSAQITQTRNSLESRASSVVGCRVTPSKSTFLDGQIAELIMYNTELSEAERDIVAAYLAAKYNLTPTNSSIFSYGSTHPNDVMGIGQESDGSNTSARGLDDILIDNPSTLGDGDYLLTGHDNGGFATTTSVPAGVVERWTQVWRADVTGTPGTVDIEFFLDVGSFASPANYIVLIESADGDFSNGGTSTHSAGRTYNAGNNSIKFTGISLSDGDYFTLAEEDADITAIADGDWDQTSTWSCTCIPGQTEVVSIPNTFDVTIDADASVLDLTIESGGTLTFSGAHTLSVYDDFNVQSSGGLTAGSGTISALKTSLSQSFTNTSGSRVDFNNLIVNNAAGLSLASGAWGVTNSLQVVAGGLDVSSADEMVMVSDASKTAVIEESMSNAFTGEFTLQRYIGTRNANYGNFSSPISDATVADLDDDLFISGVGGPDGNATVNGGGIFYSIKTYDQFNDKHDTVSSTSTSLLVGKGYEVYLATTSSTFSATTVDYVGSPNNGDILFFHMQVDQGWNLGGNPYQAFISWDSVETHASVDKSFYIFNTDNGSYQLFAGSSGNLIAPGQAFWIFKFTGGGRYHTFQEADKVSSTSSTFIRKKLDDPFQLKITSDQNSFNHLMQVEFDPNAKGEFDELDAPYLASPIQKAPAIYSKAANSDQDLVRNTVNPLESSHVLPISVYTGEKGNYSINVDNTDEVYDSYSCIYLKDNETNTAIDLSVDKQYDFESNNIGESNRFDLILSNSYTDCEAIIENKVSDQVQNIDQKFDLRNSYGTWYLDFTLDNENTNVEINVFNLSGQLVLSPNSFTLSGSGVVPIDELNALEGIYLIQIKSNNQFLNRTVKL